MIQLQLEDIDRVKLSLVLGAYNAEPLNRMDNEDWRYFQMPGQKDGDGRIVRVNKGKLLGGLYASPKWEYLKGGPSGYGAIELLCAIKGYACSDDVLPDVCRELARIGGLRPVWLDWEANCLMRNLPVSEAGKYELKRGFSAEALKYLGCQIERIYTFSNGHRFPVKDEQGRAVFRFSFGAYAEYRKMTASNFNPAVMHKDFGLFELSNFTTAEYIHEGESACQQVVASPFYPIFLFRRTSFDSEEGVLYYGEVYQPEYKANTKKDEEKGYRYKVCADGVDEDEIEQILFGDWSVERMQEGMVASEAIAEAGVNEELQLTRKVKITDENGRSVIEEQQMDADEVRLNNLLWVKDGLEAVSAYYHLNSLIRKKEEASSRYTHVAWGRNMNFGKFHTVCQLYTKLHSTAINLFLLFGNSLEDRRNGFVVCKRFSQIRMVDMPDRMTDFTVHKNGCQRPTESIVDFFRGYEMDESDLHNYSAFKGTMLSALMASAIPLEPLVRVEVQARKAGADPRIDYKVDSACVWKLMASEGYARVVDKDSTDTIGRYVKLNGPFAKELDAKSLLANVRTELINYAKSRAANYRDDDYRKMISSINDSRLITESSSINLPSVSLDYTSGYGPELDHFFYQNGALRITPHSITFIPYTQVDFTVDAAEQLPFDFRMPCPIGKEPFAIIENPEYIQRKEQLDLHRQDKEHFTQQQLKDEEKELNIWAQTNRWKFDFKGIPYDEWWDPLKVIRCFANEEYEAEEELQRDGKSFSEDQEKNLFGRMANILYSLGRPLFRYRGGGTNYMPYITENSVSKEGRSEGGSGKSVFANVFMGCAGKVFKVDGRKIRADEDITLRLANFTPHGHRVIHWEDWAKGLPVDPLYNYITSGFEFRKRHKDEIKVSLSESPGHVITSNFQQSYDDPSSSGRVVQCGFSHRFNRGDSRKNKPESKISDVMPGLRDEPADMDIELRSQIGYICALAVQFCMVAKAKVLPPMEELNSRSRIVAMGESFVAWADDFFSHDYVFNCPIDFNTIFESYKELCQSSEDKKLKFAPSTFRSKIEEYCSDRGFVVNPDVCYRDDQAGRRRKFMRAKAWIAINVNVDKQVRVLENSQSCLWFCKSQQEANDLTRDDMAELLRKYYAAPDPNPFIDIDTGKPVEATEEELSAYKIDEAYRKGYRSLAMGQARGLSREIPAVSTAPPVAAKEVLPEQLPF